MSGAHLRIDAPVVCAAAPSRTRIEWTAERLSLLARHFQAGWSHELMAQALGVSKGAISGKLDRLAEADPKKWTRSATIIALSSDRGAAKAEERRAQAAMAQAIEESIVGLTLLELEPHQCRWPLAYTDQRTFCGAEKVAGSSYCGEHRARSIVRGGN